MSALSNQERTQLRRFLEERFNLSELRNLAFDIGVSYEVVKHDTLPEFARELLIFCEHRGQINCLLDSIRQHRPDHSDWATSLLVKLPSCDARQKIQVIVAETLLERTRLLLKDLAQELGIPDEAITIVGAAWGSMHLLLGLPTEAMDFTRFRRISTLGNGRFHILSIKSFTFLPPATKKTWRMLATTHPPIIAEDTLITTISWQAAQALAHEKKGETAVSPTPPSSNHWLSQADNQSQLLDISRELVSKLSPGEEERLERLFPQYAQLAQTGQVKTMRQAQRAFGLGGDAASLSIVILSVLFTAVNTWIGQQNRQTLTELKLHQETDRKQLSQLIENTLKKSRTPRREREWLRPILVETIAKKIGDIYSSYEQGLENLTEQTGYNLELLTYEQQLRENISQARRYGDTRDRASRRSEIIEQLNRFSLQTVGQSFNILCDHLI